MTHADSQIAFRESSRFCRLPIMQPNHLNLAVPDVLETRAFFEKYFGFGDLERA